MNTNGWFKMHRKIFKNEIWEDIALFRFFIYLIGQAVFSKNGVKKGNIKIKRGQLLKSYRKIQNELEYIENNSIKSYSLSRIKRMVETLKEKNMIKTKKTKLGTLFTIINYSKYQSKEHIKEQKIKELRTELEQHKNGVGTAAEQQRNNNKNVKNVKECKESNNSSNLCSDSKKQNPNPKFEKDSMPYRAAKYLRELILENNSRQPVPETNPKDIEDWALELDRLNRLGPVGAKEKGYSWEEIGEIMEWCQDHHFWKNNILSAGKFREQITKLENQMKNDDSKNKGKNKMEMLKKLHQKHKQQDENNERSFDVL